VQHVIYNICSASFPPMTNRVIVIYLFSLTMSFMLMLLLPRHTISVNLDIVKNGTGEQC